MDIEKAKKAGELSKQIESLKEFQEHMNEEDSTIQVSYYLKGSMLSLDWRIGNPTKDLTDGGAIKCVKEAISLQLAKYEEELKSL